MAFSPNGKILASGSRDGTVLLWDAASSRPIGAPLTCAWRIPHRSCARWAELPDRAPPIPEHAARQPAACVTDHPRPGPIARTRLHETTLLQSYRNRATPPRRIGRTATHREVARESVDGVSELWGCIALGGAARSAGSRLVATRSVCAEDLHSRCRRSGSSGRSSAPVSTTSSAMPASLRWAAWLAIRSRSNACRSVTL